MSLVSSPTQSQIQTVLRSFLLSFLPAGNAVFTGYISEATLTVTSVLQGAINVGDTVLGQGVASQTHILAFGGGRGGVGTYTVDKSQTVGSAISGITMSNGVPVIAGQANRTPEPASPDFVVMTPILRTRLETNTDAYDDVAFTGSISGTTLTVSEVQLGTLAVGQTLFGVNITPGTQIVALGTGTGRTGTYTLNTSQTVASQAMASGTETVTQPTQVTIQLDVHGPTASDNAETISTLFRDAYGADFFAASGFPIAPFYADDPKQIPFQNAEDQWEFRYVISAVLQANQAVNRIPQQFADQLDITLTEVEAAFPA